MPDHYNALAAACRKATLPRKPILARPASQNQIEEIRRQQLANARENETRIELERVKTLMPNPLWDYDAVTMPATRAMIHGAIEEATRTPLNPNDALADTLIAQAQALGIAPIHLRAWIYDRTADDGWTARALESWARGMGIILAEKSDG